MQVRLSTALLLRLGLLALCIALLVVNYLTAPTHVLLPFQANDPLPGTVEFQPLDRWGVQRLTAALTGTLILLAQAAVLGAIWLRRRRRGGVEKPFVLLASGFWAVTVLITFWLSAGTTSSAQLWESGPLGSMIRSLPRIFAGQALPGPGEVLYAAAGAALFAASCSSAGARVLQLLRRRIGDAQDNNPVALLVTAFLVGQGILSCVFVLLSIFGLLTYLGVSVCLLLCLACGLGPLLSTARAAFGQARRASEALTHVPVEWRIVAGLGVALIALSALQAWSRLTWDAGSNYFASAKLMALSHRFQYTNESYLAVSGFNAEATQAALIVLFGERSARLASWLMGVAFILLCIALARDLGVGRVGAILAAVMVCTTTAFLDLMGDGKTDLFGAAMAMGALYWLLRPRPPDTPPCPVLVGLLSGFSLLYRPTYVFPLAILIIWAVIRNQIDHPSSGRSLGQVAQIARTCLSVAAFAALPVAFYLIRNLLILSEPFVSVHSATTGTQFTVATLQTWGFAPSIQMIMRLTYPFFATFVTTGQSIGVLTPLLLASTPLWLLRRQASTNLPADVKQLGVGAALTLVGWLALLPFILEIRYVLALWGLIFIVWGCYTEKTLCPMQDRAARGAAAVLAVLLMALMVRTVYSIGITTDRPVTGNLPRCIGLAQCNTIDAINREAIPGARVLILAPYTAYLRQDLLSCASSIREIRALRTAAQGGPEAFWRKTYELGFDYVAYCPDYANDFLRIDTTLAFYQVPAWLDQSVLYAAQLHTAYRLDVAVPPTDTSRLSCQQTTKGWTLAEDYGD